MNPLSKEPNKKHEPPTAAEIEQMMREQGIEPFDFDAASSDMTEEWTDEDEQAYQEFMEWRRKEREAVREVRKWQS